MDGSWVDVMRTCTTLSIVYKGHLYKGQPVRAYGFFALFSTIILRDRYSGYLTVSLINHIGCMSTETE